MMAPAQAVFAAILTCIAGAGITLAVARWRALAGWLAFVFMAASAALVSLAAAGALQGTAPSTSAPGWLVAGADFQRLQVDGLTAIFLLITAIVAVTASLYSIAYVRHSPRTVARYYPYFLLLVASIYGLLSTADTLWWLLIFWQLMVFSGYGLIRFDRATSPRGANRYAIMLELACAAIVAGSGLLIHHAGASAGSGWHSIPPRLSAILQAAPGDSTLAFLLLLLGFGITAGLWPFGQMWLPHASPGAPAPVSALLCGVVIKIGAYGLIRYFLVLLPAGVPGGFSVAACGAAIATLGTVTLFAGTMQALQQEHTKRLLAFHSIGQMGYIVLALGACLAAAGRPGAVAASIAGFAILASLFHSVNHSLFASLLYFNAGSLQQATGTQDLNRLGGLMKYMPLTGLTALIGSLAISGVPLLNGFASKWAIFVSAIQAAGSARYLAVYAAIAILTSGVTLASFMKFFGAAFLSRTSALVLEKATPGPLLRRAERRPHGLEVGWSMQLPQLILAASCVLLGLAPGSVFSFLQHAMRETEGVGAALAQAAPQPAGFLTGVAAPQSAAVFVPVALAGVLGACFLIACGISRLGSAPRREAAPWLCGYAPEMESERYIAHNFYGELKRHFSWLGGTADGRAATVKGRVS